MRARVNGESPSGPAYTSKLVRTDKCNMTYRYLGDRLTDTKYKSRSCNAVRRPDGKCIRGRNGSMLVVFETGEKVNVIGRLLRKRKIPA